MNGPEHYVKAEQLIMIADEMKDPWKAEQALAAAQVHATLALTAALIVENPPPAWREATS